MVPCKNYTIIGEDKIQKGKNYIATVILNEGYNATDIQITMKGEQLKEGEGFILIGERLEIQQVTGDITITSEEYSVSYSGSNYIIPENLSIQPSEKYVATITPNSNYEIKNLSITMGDKELTEGEDYTFLSGVLEIKDAKGNIEILPEVSRLPIDIYGEVSKSGRTLSEYGITYTRKGSSEFKYDSLYKLGMGSDSGQNTNTFTLTINYNTLVSRLGTNDFKGIRGQFYHNPLSEGASYSAWIYSEIIVTYTDNTTSTSSTAKAQTSSSNLDVKESPIIDVNFQEGKVVSTITMIIHEYEGYGATAYGWISNIWII